MDTISIRDFKHNFYTHIKAGKNLVVTNRGKKAFTVIFVDTGTDKIVDTSPPKETITISQQERIQTPRPILKEYGCGCPKNNSPLCEKHQRYFCSKCLSELKREVVNGDRTRVSCPKCGVLEEWHFLKTRGVERRFQRLYGYD